MAAPGDMVASLTVMDNAYYAWGICIPVPGISEGLWALGLRHIQSFRRRIAGEVAVRQRWHRITGTGRFLHAFC
jgi:hypothetical protein